MANVTTLKAGGTTGNPTGKGYPVVLKHEIDIAKAVAAGLLTTEYVVLADVPANTFVKVLHVENATALSMGSSPAISLGDAGSATRYVNAASTLTAGTDHTIASSELLYTAAGQLRLTLTGGTLASGIIRVCWMQVDTSRRAPTGFVGNVD